MNANHAAALVFLVLLSLTAILGLWMWTHCGVRIRLVPSSGVAYDVRLVPVRAWVCE